MRKILLCGSLLIALPAHAQNTPNPAPAASHKDADDDDKDDASHDIVVSGRRLDLARDSIQPSVGANDYKLTREALDMQPGGPDRAMKAVLLQAPGVTQDADGDGDVHIRNEHGNIQYRLNGVTVPDSFAGFGALVDTRVAETIDVITGALPAQYGYRTAGIVQLKTRAGAFDADGDISLYGGGNGTIQPSATYRNSLGRLNMFVSASYLRNDLGIANSTADSKAIHDRTEQYRGFAYLSYLIDDKSRITAFGGTSIGTFQTPNVPGIAPAYLLAGNTSASSAKLDQTQRQQTHFGVLAYQYSGDAIDVQAGPFFRWSRARHLPDPKGGELVFNGVDTALTQHSLAAGLQADASYKASPSHTIRFGLFFQHERNSTDSVTRVFALSGNCDVTACTPIAIPVSEKATAKTFGIYLQDEWKIAEQLTLNYGLRYDHFWWTLSEGQLSPRAGLVWKPAPATTVHLGYARYFTPPPLTLIGNGALAAFNGTTGEAEVLQSNPVRSEREHSFDLGAQQIIAGHLTLGIDLYYKIKRDLLDETTFGSTQLLAPFNYARSTTWGVELSANFENGPLEAYINVARGEQKASEIVSGQFFFSRQDLAYIAQNTIYTDHSQKWTISGGASLKLDNGLGKFRPSVDFLYGSGLRAGDPTGIVPNGGTEAPYVQVNLGLAQQLGQDAEKAVTIRVDVTNLFDKVYLLHDGSGVGAGAPQYGPRRAVFFGIRKAF